MGVFDDLVCFKAWENELSPRDERELERLRIALRAQWMSTPGVTFQDSTIRASEEYFQLKKFVDSKCGGQTGGKKPAAKKPAVKKPAAKKPPAKKRS